MSDTDTTVTGTEPTTDAAIAEMFGITDESNGTETEAPEGEGQEPEDEGTDEELDSAPDFEDLHEDWKKEIKKLRREAAANRVKSKKADAGDDAVEAARAEVRQEYAEKFAAAEIKAALSGLVEDPSDLVEDLNLKNYVTEDGDVDSDKVQALKERYAKIAGRRRTPRVGHGRQSDTTARKTSPADQFAETMKDFF